MISVIIPVFNAAAFLEKAIASVLIQPEVVEVMIVDDGSTDTSLHICNGLAKQNNRIKMLQHPDKQNHGRSASRNLGIKNATGKYIAFLDADDYYLPNRFTNDIEILEKEVAMDGVYNAISAHFYREATTIEKEKLQLTTIREPLAPELLFENMGPIGHMGYFSGIGLTVRKTIFEKVGYFNEALEVAEDTELWLKMALLAKLQSGIIFTPVAMRGVHEENVSFHNDALYAVNNLSMYEYLLVWSFNKNIVLSRIDLIWKKIWMYRALNCTNLASDLLFWSRTIVKYPKLLKLKRVYKTFPLLKRVKHIFKIKTT